MIPYQVDPSLHPAEPAPAQLDDGCSPPEPPEPPAHAKPAQPEPAEALPGTDSDF